MATRRAAGQGERRGHHRVGNGQGQGGIAHVAEPADAPGTHHPAARTPEQRAGQQDQPERQHADPADAGQGETHVVADEPQQRGGAQHAGQAESGVRCRDPADQREHGQHGEPGAGGRAGGDRPGDGQRTVGTGRHGAGVTARSPRAAARRVTQRQAWQLPRRQARRGGLPQSRFVLAEPRRGGMPGAARRRRAAVRLCPREPDGPSRTSGRRGAQRACMTSRTRPAVSLGVRPTRTPTFSRASFLAWAVPADPEMIAPAWPIVLPSGAVKPAT